MLLVTFPSFQVLLLACDLNAHFLIPLSLLEVSYLLVAGCLLDLLSLTLAVKWCRLSLLLPLVQECSHHNFCL